MQTEQLVHLERVGSRQMLYIPREFELAGENVLIRKEGERLIVEPAQKSSLLAYLATLEPIEDEFPDLK
jgi:antitoxin VapB